MGNNQTLYQQVKKTWFEKAQKECKRLNITLKKDKTHKQNFMELHSIQESDQTVMENQVRQMLSKPVGVFQQILDFRDSINFQTTSQSQDVVVLQLIDIYTNVLILYYGLDLMSQPRFLTKNTIRTLATKQIFDEKLYYNLYGTRRDEQQLQNERLHDRIRSTQEWSFEDFGIPVKYYLNDTTRDYLKLGDSRHKLISSVSTLENSDLYAPMNIECVEPDQIPNRPSHINKMSALKEENPYQAAVNALNQIQIKENPIDKLSHLRECFDCIFQAITEYYKGFAVKPSNPSTDDLIKIFNYILSRGSLQNPLTHHDMMYKYCINSVGVEAYQLTVMQASLNYI